MKFQLAAVLAVLACAPLGAQVGDSVPVLPELSVTASRGRDSVQRIGASVTVVKGAGVQRGHIATTLDEAIAFVPGVLVGNRWNHSLDQRLSIRGFGSRANFGLRGVKVLLDGVPQTLPDGQSQLTNVDLALIERVEVLRGAASALHGNAAGGVVSFTSRVVPVAPWELTASTEHGSFSTSRTQVTAGARTGAVGGTLSLSRFATEGFRLHSAAEQRRASLAVDWSLPRNTTVSVRAAIADDPRAENPGALTLGELESRRDSASATNISRGADKAVAQQQLSVGVRGTAGGFSWSVTGYGLLRDLENPLGTPPPAPAASNEGTWVGIDRRVLGVRSSATVALHRGPRAPSLTFGADAQAMRDDRVNRRAIAGAPTDDVLVRQREDVREVAPFVQGEIPLSERFSLRGGARYDRVRFGVRDDRLDDGDASGTRTMSAASGHGGITFNPDPATTVWASLATSFETPTTTELANRAEGDGGFNQALDPQRSLSAEIGARWRGRRMTFEGAAYVTRTRDALIAFRENAGRTYFRNAGETRITGAEASVSYEVVARLVALATWTHTSATFIDYRLTEGDAITILDGNRLAGIPRNVARIGLRGTVGQRIVVDVDHAWSGSMFADDRNLVKVEGWGAGVTGLRLRWDGGFGAHRVVPFVVVTNVFDRDYVGSVTINGGFGRVYEPAAGRTLSVGVSLGTGG